MLSVIKQQIDIDAKKYHETCERRKAAGAKGGNTKASNAKQKAEESSNTKQMVANDSNAKQSQNVRSNAKQSLTNLADSDCDCGSDCDNEKNNPPISPQGDNAPTKEKPTRHKYGQYKNVLLSDDEMAKLKAEYPSDWQARIERLSEYMASTGKTYKSHLATIRSWARKDKDRCPPAASNAPAKPKDDNLDDLLTKMTKWGWD